VSPGALGAVILLGFATVAVRRRSAGIAVVAVQSLLLGSVALGAALDEHHNVPLAVVLLVTRGVVLPALLLGVVRGTREAAPIAAERVALRRMLIAVAVVGAVALLTPPFGLESQGAERIAVGLLVLGVVIATVRRAVVFQALGFLVAENGVLVAGLASPAGLPGTIELALLFDLVAVLTVAAAFGTKIHEHLGTSDTELLRELHD